MQLVNLTPHSLHLYSDEGNYISTFESRGQIRLGSSFQEVERRHFSNAEGSIPIKDMFFDDSAYIEIDGQQYNTLPEPKEDTVYVVSKMVKNAFPEREDFFVVSETVRDENGKICGFKSLSKGV
jgi:hypothetical protein